jgi:hypothetical protein
MSDCQRDSRPRLSWWLTMAWVGLCHMSLGLWCVGVEFGGGGRRRGEGQVGTCRANGPRAVKGGREAWTEGLGCRWPAAVADIWDIDRRKCTCEWPCWPSQDEGCASRAGLRGLGGRPVEDSGDTCRATGDAYGVRYSRAGLVVWVSKPSVAGLRVWASKPGQRFRGGTDGTWRHRGVHIEAKLSHEGRGGRRMKITSGWTIAPSGQVVRLKISKGKTEIV